jgi:hypothetical protein
MTATAHSTFIALSLGLSLGLAGLSAQAAGRPYLGITGQPGTPGYSFSYNGQDYSGNSHFNPQAGRVLRSTWANVQGTNGQVAAELGRLRVAEFGAARATAADGSLFGVGGNLREARFEDQLILQGNALNANTVLHFDYHFGGTAGGRIETNASGRLDINATLAMSMGSEGVEVKEHTWATQDVLAGGQQRSTLASSGIFDVSATGFSMKLGTVSPSFGSYLIDLSWWLAGQSQCMFSLSPLPPHLPAPAGGCSYSADYGNTASFMGLSLRDGSTGALLDPASYSLRSASGFDYAQGFAPAVPEPQGWALLALGLGVVALRSRQCASAQQRRVR